jgi:hypothetical protein
MVTAPAKLKYGFYLLYYLDSKIHLFSAFLLYLRKGQVLYQRQQSQSRVWLRNHSITLKRFQFFLIFNHAQLFLNYTKLWSIQLKILQIFQIFDITCPVWLPIFFFKIGEKTHQLKCNIVLLLLMIDFTF